ncbi:MAG TPA: pyridoxamine 5'-phosphate oxidase family protein [Patescibacteria group bacterium]
MDNKVIDILNKERSCALSISLSDNTPHTSCMVFAYKKDPLEIYFLTDKDSKKMEPLLNGLPAKASFVLGFDEKNMITLQTDGEIRMEEDRGKIEEIRKIYFEKYPDHKRYENEGSCYLVFTPIWWRYTDFNPVPNLIISS